MPERPGNGGIRLLETVIVLLALVIGLRLFQLQIVDHGRFLGLANRQWQREESLPAQRGNLYDRSGIPLAVGTLQYQVSADPRAYRSLPLSRREVIMATLTEQLDTTRPPLRRALKAKGRYALLHPGLPLSLEDREALTALGVVHLQPCAKRLYPMGALAAPLIGFVNGDGEGVSGLEAGLEARLSGEPGRALVQKDELGRSLISPLNRHLVEPRRGSDVYLTIDHKVQAITDLELERAALESGARAGSAVVLDPHSGDILALASWPAVDSRDESYRPEHWKLLPVQGVYEPGSTLKAVTSIALLEKGEVDLATQEDAEDGSAVIDGFTIRDDRPHPGYLSFREAFAYSSNICFAKLSKRLDKQELFSCLRDLGFGNRHGLELPGEMDGVLRESDLWSRRSKLTLIFGQEISATPLQVTSAIGAVAADGRLMKPRILRGVGDPEGRRLDATEPVYLRRVCRRETAATIRGLMGEVVSRGTGKNARVPGLAVGGKTGTAQKFEGGELKRGKYMASFVGFAPLDAPRLVIGIFLDEPEQGFYHGGQSAAPAFARIVEKLAVTTPELLVPGEAELAASPREGRPVPSFLELEVAAAEERAAELGLPMRFRGHGDRVVAQVPDPGCRRPADALLVLVLGGGEPGAEAPPELVGLSLRAARCRALAAGYRVLPRGRGMVVEQGRPDPGRGGAIPLRLAAGS